jgi:molybdenum cofactor guanylyltransferase
VALCALNTDSILAVVLAGGESSRMGQNKALRYAPRLKNTMIAHCRKMLAQIDGAQVVVSGDQHLNGIADIYSQRGPLSGIHAVLQNIDGQSFIQELLFVPVDMPNLSIVTLNELVLFGRKHHSAAYLNKCFLPCYLPYTAKVINIVTEQIERSQNWSIKALMTQLSAQSLICDKYDELINVNEPQTWDLHCS